MGYPGKNHKQYQAPKRPFELSRIEEETHLVINYGLRNKREVWKAKDALRRYRKAARDIIALMSAGTDQGKIQDKKDQLVGYLSRLGLLAPDAGIDHVLSLKVEQQLGRRLQTIVYQTGLARSPKQARQFITHGHIAISGKKVTVPGYLVKKAEEESISYYGKSPLVSDLHAERGRIAKTGR
ncbi:MAG: 30S ribosomal protein S4 [Methanospirillaceae archaeon]|nr:30S ribosomal protein S4 [Methanospirillaceae archaeon]